MTMTEAMFGTPIETDFGFDFNYSSWDPNTELMLTNVPFNSDYRDIVVMDSQASFNTWLDSKPNFKYRNASMQKFNEGIVKIDLPINEAMKYNYLRARNGVSPVTSVQRDYFYFITGIRYGAPDTTYISIQLDVINTFFYEVKFGQCYVEAGHIGIANENSFNRYGREYLTVPESHDIGNEYRVIHSEAEKIMSTEADSSNVSHGYDILVCSTLDLTQDPGVYTNPHINSSKGSYFQNIPTGASFYLFPSADDFKYFLDAYSQMPWITQSIISVTLIPNMTRYIPDYDYGTNLSTYPLFKFYAAGPGVGVGRQTPKAIGWRDADWITRLLGDRYKNLFKFLTFPYMIIELTTWTGSPLAIKPEAWQDANATVFEIPALMPPGQRIAIAPYRYNYEPDIDAGNTQQTIDDGYDDYAESLDFATFLDNFVQVPVVNNGFLNFMASNRNGLAFSQTSAQWTEQRALAGAQAGYDVQNAQIANVGRQSGIANTAETQTSNLMAQTGVTNSIIGAAGTIPGLAAGGGAAGMAAGGARSAAPGFAVSAGRAAGGVGGEASGVAGAATGMMQAGMSAAAGMQAAQISVGARSESAVSDIRTAGSVRDTNNAYATMAAKGDYKNAIAGIQARVQDAKMIQPSTSGQFNGDAFNLINGKFGWSLRFKFINNNAMRMIGDYWLRYGYEIHRYLQFPNSPHVMSKFTYWKLTETYITQGAFPEGFKQIIRGIFEKGVTVWKNPDDIGNTDLADNDPLNGISY